MALNYFKGIIMAYFLKPFTIGHIFAAFFKSHQLYRALTGNVKYNIGRYTKVLYMFVYYKFILYYVFLCVIFYYFNEVQTIQYYMQTITYQ